MAKINLQRVHSVAQSSDEETAKKEENSYISCGVVDNGDSMVFLSEGWGERLTVFLSTKASSLW